eukprot:1653376-Rhodomonas_salina.1
MLEPAFLAQAARRWWVLAVDFAVHGSRRGAHLFVLCDCKTARGSHVRFVHPLVWRDGSDHSAPRQRGVAAPLSPERAGDSDLAVVVRMRLQRTRPRAFARHKDAEAAHAREMRGRGIAGAALSRAQDAAGFAKPLKANHTGVHRCVGLCIKQRVSKGDKLVPGGIWGCSFASTTFRMIWMIWNPAKGISPDSICTAHAARLQRSSLVVIPSNKSGSKASGAI